MADSGDLEKMDNTGLAGLAVDFLRRSALHYGMWFNAVSYTHLTLPTNREV